jgi:hypothetical protein
MKKLIVLGTVLAIALVWGMFHVVHAEQLDKAHHERLNFGNPRGTGIQ